MFNIQNMVNNNTTVNGYCKTIRIPQGMHVQQATAQQDWRNSRQGFVFSTWTTNEVEGRSGNKKTKTDFAVLQRKCKDSGRTIFHC